MGPYFVCKAGNQIATISAETKEQATEICKRDHHFTPTSVYTSEEWYDL